MRYGITGASGLIGTALTSRLTEIGDQAVALPRGTTDANLLEDLDVVVHLAGAPIAEGRWNAQRKTLIRDSRVHGTAQLVEALSRCRKPPAVFVSSSAIGFYGSRGNEELDETSAGGRGFLSEVAHAWEAQALRAAGFGARVVLLRTGIVLSAKGGAFPRLLQPFQWFVGGPIGQGQQWMSWIHVVDEIEAILFAGREAAIEGPLNATAPNPVTNLQFAQELGRLLGKPSLIRTPAFTVKTVMGREMAEELILTSQRVLPRELDRHGFQFRFPNLNEALKDLLPGRR
jgi:uncharacterized protein